MKKHLLFAALLITGGAFAQTCTPDASYAGGNPGLYPHGPLGPTCELIAPKTIVSLTDTTVPNATIGSVTLYITRMRINSVAGLPAGFSLSTDVIGSADANGPWGYWNNTGSTPTQVSAIGCAYVTAAQSAWNSAIGGGTNNDGVYPLVFEVDAYVAATNPAFALQFIGGAAWVSAIDPSVGGGSFYILDTLVVPADYADITATIAGPSDVAPAAQYGYSVANNPNVTYNWTATNGTIVSGQGTNAVQVTWAGSGSIEVDMTDDGCSGNETMAITATPIGIDEAAGINASIYPNPSNGIFTLRLDNIETLNIRIMDVSGKVVRAERLAGANLYTIDLTPVKTGVYIMEIETATGRTFKRLVRN
ncbi:MAG: T9SS type A sorting domain-containing protein [Flavobacteriales bacterium]|nr:T9SS type A sorting domain-containing protein [Flavobacteriales bacterium]